jgi:hypothetical protein
VPCQPLILLCVYGRPVFSLVIGKWKDRRIRAKGLETYGEAWRRGPGGLTLDIADECLVDGTSAEKAVGRALDVGTHRWECDTYLVSMYAIGGISCYIPKGLMPDAHLARTCLRRGDVRAAGACSDVQEMYCGGFDRSGAKQAQVLRLSKQREWMR